MSCYHFNYSHASNCYDAAADDNESVATLSVTRDATYDKAQDKTCDVITLMKQRLVTRVHCQLLCVFRIILWWNRGDNTISPGSLQILHVNGNHWLAISTLDSGYEVTVYDSLHFSLSKETKTLLAKLLKTSRRRLIVGFGNTNKQADFDDCGLFAAAYCIL